eukprot:3265722-Amphidinium_carterae.1
MGLMWLAHLVKDSIWQSIPQDGNIVAWGDPQFGGEFLHLSGDARRLYANGSAFVVQLEDGSLKAWGNERHGGIIPEHVTLRGGDVASVVGTRNAFAALTHDGAVFTWGQKNDGGDSVVVAEKLREGVKVITWEGLPLHLVNTQGKYALVKETWLASLVGGTSLNLGSIQPSPYEVVYSNEYAFAAVKRDGVVVTGLEPFMAAYGTAGYTASQVALWLEPFCWGCFELSSESVLARDHAAFFSRKGQKEHITIASHDAGKVLVSNIILGMSMFATQWCLASVWSVQAARSGSPKA